MKGAAITLLAVLVVVGLMAAGPSEAAVCQSAVTCPQVDAALAPCVSYLTQGGTPSDTCCAGVSKLKAMAQSKPDRQTACTCVKEAAGRYPNLKDDAAAALPQKCNVQINIPISRTVDCRNV